MITRLCVLLCLFVGIKNFYAQHGNEWINYTQKHYKLSIPKTGLYRIDSTTLANAGIPLTGINPKNFQLFIKGEEQYIRINGENDGVFNTNDYIEFYGEKNDGRFDSLAYTNITRIPNPYIALFNDTCFAFLTWNASLTNKRVTAETDINFAGYTAADYFYTEKVDSYHGYYSQGSIPYPGVYDPRYLKGEGYGRYMNLSNDYASFQSSITTDNVFQSSSLPVYIKTSFSGVSQHHIGTNDHHLSFQYYDNAGSYNMLIDTGFKGFNQLFAEKQITSNKLQNSSHIKVNTVYDAIYSSNYNQNNIHYISIKYPQLTSLSNASESTFYVNDNSSASKSYLDIQNAIVGTNTVFLYDLTNHKFISTTNSSNNVKVLIPNSGNEKKCFLTTSASLNYITSLTPVNQNGYFINYKTTNPDSAFVIVSNKSLEYAATEYAIYRQSPAGGNNNVILGYVDELYDQFAYGNNKNPIAIRNFCRFLIDSLPTPPKYLLLLGKSIKNEELRINSTYWNACLVPTMGRPASDNLFTTNLKGLGSTVSFIPTGRISAKNDNEAIYFLNKVKVHESTDKGINSESLGDWRKHVLHFAGGTTSTEQSSFQGYLSNCENIIEDTLFGGKVYNFYKTTTSPIQITISDSVTNLMNYGASIVTFFGHGSVTGFDQAIDNPNAYTNKDKYPLFIANSCYSGDIHRIESSSASEKFVLINEKGSIGFIASSSTGFANYLNSFSNQLYRSLGYNKYYGGIGDAVKNSCYKISLDPYTDQITDITNLEMTLEGDPSVKLTGFKKPDYEIKNSYVSFNTTNNVDSIGISIFIKNLGHAIRDSFIVRTIRYFPNGDSLTILKKHKTPFFQDTLQFNILKDFINGVGLNHFKVNIDYFNEVSELVETNNATTGNIDLFINGGDVIPVYPYKYAIIPQTSQVTLKASTADPFAPQANYRLQLDTNDTFLNPINSTIISSAGGVIEWTVNLPFGDSTVYFWRVTKDSVSTADKISWRESSFQVITGKYGWAQAHFHQFKNDKFQFINYIKPQRKFAFLNNLISLECTNEYKTPDLYGIRYVLNGVIKSNYNFNYNDGWSIAVFDSVSGAAWTSLVTTPSTFATPYNNCLAFANEHRASFDFGPISFCGTNTNWQNDLLNFLTNGIPVNSYILAYSSNAHQSSTYPASLYTAFQSFGGYSVSSIGDSLPAIIFGKKRSNPFPGCGHEVIGTSTSSKIVLTDSMNTKWDRGYIESELIGPAAKWSSLHWRYQGQSSQNDTIILKVLRISTNGNIDTVPGIALNSSTFDLYNLENYIDANQFPYIKLVALTKDNITHQAPQLKKWQVIFDEVPECALNPNKGYTANNSSVLQEGDNLIVKMPIENIGTLPFTDSLVVTYWISDRNNVSHNLPQKLKPKPFVPGQLFMDTVFVNSFQYPGTNYLWMDVNPVNNSKYQLEKYHFNNVTRIAFNVNSDKVNPLLDVTFDGTHILNGDIVSSKPHVLVTLKDENKFLALNDTDNFKVFIQYPNQVSEKRLYFIPNGLQFTPAQLPSNSCKIEWSPEFAEDGKYKLIVQATDRSKNVSGAIDYNIQFEVINKQTVTEVLNYPNPFSTATRFVFTLTGSEVPDIFTVQIMTITGKVVREITKEELGNLHIGRNITQYAWDGKDEFGDKLGNGVYLYRVITRHNNEAVEKKQTDADAFFKKGIGKLVIIR